MSATPRLQLALDQTDLPGALGVLGAACSAVDVVECGTLLVLGEGLAAVRALRAVAPAKPLIADVRIAEAGGLIAHECFAAGADWVTCVAGASPTTIEQVVAVAQQSGGEVQVELSDRPPSAETARRWRDIGVAHAIVKRSRDLELAGSLSWTERTLESIDELAAHGFTVSVTGGITPAGLELFAGRPVGIVIVGREIAQAQDPALAARTLRARIAEVFAA